MTVQPVSDPNMPIGEILKAAGSEGIMLESEERGRYALLPLDDDVIDLLIERNPDFRADSARFATHGLGPVPDS